MFVLEQYVYEQRGMRPPEGRWKPIAWFVNRTDALTLRRERARLQSLEPKEVAHVFRIRELQVFDQQEPERPLRTVIVGVRSQVG